MRRPRAGRIQRVRIAALFLIAPAAVCCLPLLSRAQAPEYDLLRAVSHRYRALHSVSADFKQIFQGGQNRLEENGWLAMKKPNKMHWEYRWPEKKTFVSDGRFTFFYVPGDAQVYTARVESGADSPLSLLIDPAKLLADFHVSREVQETPLSPAHRLLRLEPKSAGKPYQYLLVEIDPTKLQVERLSVIEPTRNRNDYILTNVRENPKLDDKLFRFKKPPGVEEIRQ